MTQVVQASELTLHEVKTQLGLQEAEDEQFFSEWQEPLSKLTDVEQRSLDQVKADFLYLNQYPMSEEVVKLVVLSPPENGRLLQSSVSDADRSSGADCTGG